VILLSLLWVVADELLDVGLYELDLDEDVVDGCRPYEGPEVVSVVDVVADLLDLDGHRNERAAGLAGNDANQVSIWLMHDEPTRGKWKCTFGWRSSMA
jgi:hypothetical protein